MFTQKSILSYLNIRSFKQASEIVDAIISKYDKTINELETGMNLLVDKDNKEELLTSISCLKEFIQRRIDNQPKKPSDLTILLTYQLLSARIQDLYIKEKENLYVPDIFKSIEKT